MEPEPQQGVAQNPGELFVFLIRKNTKCSETGDDTLLLQGIERHEARALVSSGVERKLAQWSAGRGVSAFGEQRTMNAELRTMNAERYDWD
jgi:hypothetical protein